MSEPSRQLPASTHPRPTASQIDTTARWVDIADDVALGCECANPYLQIERWAQEIFPPPATSS